MAVLAAQLSENATKPERKRALEKAGLGQDFFYESDKIADPVWL